MKRNFKSMAIVGLLVGVLTIGGASVVALATGNAYQNYKSAALQTVKAMNLTVTADVTIKQDGDVLLSGNSIIQMDGQSQYSRNQMLINGEAVDMERATVDGTTITRVGDQYTSTNHSDREHDWNEGERFSASSSTMKLMEMVADLLVGDVKTHFTGSGDTVAVNLEGAQIPELLNVAASAAMERNANRPNKAYSEKELFDGMFENLPIAKDIKIARITLESELKDGYLSENIITIVLTGKDNNGDTHEIELVCNANVSDIGSTTPDSIDTTGKTVTEAAMDKYYR